MSSLTHQKLEKSAEIGLGKHIFISYFERQKTGGFPFESVLGKEWKQNYFLLQKNKDIKEIENKLINTLNDYTFAKHIIFDYLGFILFLRNIERVSLAHGGFESIIVFNPRSFYPNIKNKLVKRIIPLAYKNLAGNQYKLDKDCLELLDDDIFSKLHYLNSKKVLIVGLEDSKFALKLSASIKNSIFESVDCYDDFLSIIKHEFTTKN